MEAVRKVHVCCGCRKTVRGFRLLDTVVVNARLYCTRRCHEIRGLEPKVPGEDLWFEVLLRATEGRNTFNTRELAEALGVSLQLASTKSAQARIGNVMAGLGFSRARTAAQRFWERDTPLSRAPG